MHHPLTRFARRLSTCWKSLRPFKVRSSAVKGSKWKDCAGRFFHGGHIHTDSRCAMERLQRVTEKVRCLSSDCWRFRTVKAHASRFSHWVVVEEPIYVDIRDSRCHYKSCFTWSRLLLWFTSPQLMTFVSLVRINTWVTPLMYTLVFRTVSVMITVSQYI
jgi:hypothetical protein